MSNAFDFLSEHKKQFLTSLLLFIVFTFLAGILLTGISVFALSQKKFQTTSIASQSASLFLSPYLLIGEMANSCSWKTFHSTLSLLSHSPELNELVIQTIDEYQQTGVSEETAEGWKPYAFTIDKTLQDINECQQTSPIFRGLLKAIFKDQTNFEQLASLSSLFPPLIENYHQLAGFEQTQNILILIQNNRELRATGGFLGSYAYITVNKGKVEKFELQDIYVPDGQLTGHVDPPPPIQQAFQQGFWKLRDANWHPDFPQSVTNISWFFEQAGWAKPNAAIAIDVTAIEAILQTIDPIYLTEFSKNYHAEEIYPLLQTKVEEDFFAGSTKKRDLLNHVFIQIIQKLKETSINQKFSIAQKLTQSLSQKHILLFSDETEIQQKLEVNNFAGKLENKNGGDYFSIIESNLGVNKTNCCVMRNVSISKHIDRQEMATQTKIQYQIDKIPEIFSQIAGDYKSYVRIYFPEETALQYIKVNNQEYTDFIKDQIKLNSLSEITSSLPSVHKIHNLTEIGFWIYVPKDHTINVELSTKTNISLDSWETLSIQKQPGTMDFFNYFLVIKDGAEIWNNILKTDLKLDL